MNAENILFNGLTLLALNCVLFLLTSQNWLSRQLRLILYFALKMVWFIQNSRVSLYLTGQNELVFCIYKPSLPGKSYRTLCVSALFYNTGILFLCFGRIEDWTRGLCAELHPQRPPLFSFSFIFETRSPCVTQIGLK